MTKLDKLQKFKEFCFQLNFTSMLLHIKHNIKR